MHLNSRIAEGANKKPVRHPLADLCTSATARAAQDGRAGACCSIGRSGAGFGSTLSVEGD